MSWLLDAFSLPQECRHNIAIEGEEGVLTYQDLSSRIESLAQSLRKQGVFAGARVSFIAHTSLQSIISLFALFLLRATPCPLSTRLPKEAIPPFLERGRISFFLDTSSFSLQKISSQEPLPESFLLFTSGSMGQPKLVCLHFSLFLESALGAAPSFGLDKKPGKWLLSLPLFHVSGLSILFRCFKSASCILLSPISSALATQATHLSFVPTQLIRALDEDRKFPFLTHLLLGGAPIPPFVLQRALLQNIPILTTYGLTETASLVTVSKSPNLHLGKVLPGRELMIDEAGEIKVKGKTLFLGYDLGSTPHLPLTSDGWFATGDLGALTKEGHLVYKGRKDNLFISGGENIYPEEIEKELNSLPHVLSSVVVPIDDEIFGKRPIAFLHMNQAKFPSKESLQEALSHKIPKFSIPIQFYPFPNEAKNHIKINRSYFKLLIKN